MNKENINTLIGMLENEANPYDFRMSSWASPSSRSSCGTAACLAGHISLHLDSHLGLGQPTLRDRADRLAFNVGRDWLEINGSQASELFLMPGVGCNLYDRIEQFDRLPPRERITAAIATLVHLRDTGNVDWRVGLRAIGRDPEDFSKVMTPRVALTEQPQQPDLITTLPDAVPLLTS